MDLYIVRHGIAAEPGSLDDFDRPLTPEGIEKLEGVGKGLRILEVQPEIILTSPLIRARQTADCLKGSMQSRARIELIDALRPLARRVALYRELQARANFESILLVGHQPDLGELAGEIAWGNAESGLDFKKGGACKLEVADLHPAPIGRLVWFLTPAILRRLR
jgi:phosphohistidine phosphatase